MRRFHFRLQAVACSLLLAVIHSAAHTAIPSQEAPLLLPGKTELENMVELSTSERGIVELKQRFAVSRRAEEKAHIASVLLSAGVKDEQYLNFLVAIAKPAIDSTDPTPVVSDEHGDLARGKLNPAFVRWCKKKGIDPKTAAYGALYSPGLKVIDLASSGDPRTYDLLLKGLHSNNFLVAAYSARGLAKIGDPRAIDEIIRTCRKPPAGGLLVIAITLVYFDDPKAQTAVDAFIENKKVLADYREDANKRGVKGLFGY